MYTQTSSGLLRGGAAANVQMHRVLFICAELCRMRGPNVETFISILYIYKDISPGTTAWPLQAHHLELCTEYRRLSEAPTNSKICGERLRSVNRLPGLILEPKNKTSTMLTKELHTYTHPRLSVCVPLGRLLVYLAVPATHTRHAKMRASGEPRAGWPPQQTARCINTHRIHDCVHVIWNVHSYCCRHTAHCI